MTKLESVIKVVVDEYKDEVEEHNIESWKEYCQVLMTNTKEFKEEVIGLLAYVSINDNVDLMLNSDGSLVDDNGEVVEYKDLFKMIKKSLFN